MQQVLAYTMKQEAMTKLKSKIRIKKSVVLHLTVMA